MNCPVCNSRLKTIDRMGVEIDICPDCKGIWLDRGELDKLMSMAASQTSGSHSSNQYDMRPEQRSDADRRDRYEDSHDRHEHDDHGHRSNEHGGYTQNYGQKQKRTSWLGEILGGLGGDD